ncbi:hypothetical protein KUL118_24150 [Tenacibaculum sp. KUL118]|nr:hypothetical protein KUL118_24150 [Tenacibaculum sp. KUL118]
MSELPRGWTTTKFTEVLDISGGTQPPKSEFIPAPQDGYIRLLQIRDFGEKPVPTFIPDNGKRKTCRKDDVLIGRYGASIGRICTGMEGAYNVALAKVIKPDFIDGGFLKYYLMSENFQQPLRLLSRSAQNGFNKKDLSNFDFVYPQLEEQKRIADKLDSVLAKVEAAQARLDKIPAILKRFRQSVLAAATSGELTKEWRDHRDLDSGESLANLRLQVKVKKSSNELDESKLRELPKGWSWAQVKEVGSVQLGRQRSPKYHSGENMRPYLRVMNVKEGFIDTTDIMEMVFDESDFQKYRLFPGDILLNEGQSYELVGRPAIYNGEVEGACFTNTLVRFRPFFPLKPRFSFYVFMTYMKNGRFQQIASRTVNISHLGAGRFSELEFPFPPVEEQEEIERKVEGLFSKANMVEKNYESARSRLDSLSQAILSKAFKGELLTSPVESEIKEIESSVEAIHA